MVHFYIMKIAQKTNEEVQPKKKAETEVTLAPARIFNSPLQPKSEMVLTKELSDLAPVAYRQAVIAKREVKILSDEIQTTPLINIEEESRVATEILTQRYNEALERIPHDVGRRAISRAAHVEELKRRLAEAEKQQKALPKLTTTKKVMLQRLANELEKIQKFTFVFKVESTPDSVSIFTNDMQSADVVRVNGVLVKVPQFTIPGARITMMKSQPFVKFLHGNGDTFIHGFVSTRGNDNLCLGDAAAQYTECMRTQNYALAFALCIAALKSGVYTVAGYNRLPYIQGHTSIIPYRNEGTSIIGQYVEVKCPALWSSDFDTDPEKCKVVGVHNNGILTVEREDSECSRCSDGEDMDGHDCNEYSTDTYEVINNPLFIKYV